MLGQRSKKYRWIFWLIIGITGMMLVSFMISDTSIIPTGPKVGLVEIDTPIYSSSTFVKDLNYFADREDIVAIVVRIETPGGAVAASQEIFEKVKSISQSGVKPILASMGNVAASGGYYVAIGADTIVANPGTATGSIGVIIGYPVAAELMEKIGVTYEVAKSGKLKDSGSTFREVTKEDKSYFDQLVNDIHLQFVQAVSEMRKIPIDKMDKIATGRVFTGLEAHELGLVDIIGTFENTVYLAGNLAGYLDKPVLIRPPRKKKGFLNLLMEDLENRIPWNYSYPRPEFRLN